ncbi:hypothetical protein D4Q76_02695, partial [archaeon]
KLFNVTVGFDGIPTFALNSANTTIAGKPVNFSVKITDETALSGYIFETNNIGTWINTTWVALASGGTAQNITTLNSTAGLAINYSFYANDSSNNWAVGRWSIITIPANIKYSSEQINSTFAGEPIKHGIYWNADYGLSGYIFSFDNGVGSFTNDTWVGMTGTGNWSNITKTVNSIVGAQIKWKVYANNTDGYWNVSGTYSYITKMRQLPMRYNSDIFGIIAIVISFTFIVFIRKSSKNMPL